MKALLIIVLAIGAVIFMNLMLRWRLEWPKEYSDVDPRKCWRFILSVLIVCSISLLIVHLKFPDTKWRDQAFVVGGLGVLPGLLAGAVWQLMAHESFSRDLPRHLQRGILTVGFGSLLVLMAVLLSDAIPELQQQQLSFDQLKSIRSLASGDISQVDIILEPTRSITVTDPVKIESFKKFLRTAKRGGNGDLKNLQIQVHADGNSFTYDTFVAPHYPDDIMLKFSISKNDRWIRLPGLKRWLDENILNKQKSKPDR